MFGSCFYFLLALLSTSLVNAHAPVVTLKVSHAKPLRTTFYVVTHWSLDYLHLLCITNADTCSISNQHLHHRVLQRCPGGWRTPFVSVEVSQAHPTLFRKPITHPQLSTMFHAPKVQLALPFPHVESSNSRQRHALSNGTI